MNFFEEIESYLDGSLDEQTRLAFETELQRNPALAAELALRRELETLLASGPENALRENLNILGERYKNTPGTPNTRWMWLIASLLILVIAVWVLLRQGEKPAQQQVTPPVTQPVDTVKHELKTHETMPQKETRTEPIAGNFKPNAALESMIGSQLRDGGFKFRIVQPSANASLVAKNGSLTLQISGRIDGADKLEDRFQLKLFSNKKADFEADRALFSIPLTFSHEDGHFSFQVLKKMKLASGLYYYLIENEESGAVNLVGKFRLN